MEVSSSQNTDLDNNPIQEESQTEGTDESIRKAFSDFDQDGDGTISIAELRHVLGPGGALSQICGSLNNDEIDTLINVADEDGDGEVSFDEFVNLINRMKGGDSEEDMKKAFKFFDIDGDGAISKEDMKVAMMRLGNKLTDKDICDIFEDADDDGDGLVDFDEFVRNVARKA